MEKVYNSGIKGYRKLPATAVSLQLSADSLSEDLDETDLN
jgi:hypothetical protein